MTRTKLADRVLPVYTKGEEICNMVTHIIGAVLGVVAIVLCSIMAHSAYGVVSGIIFGVSMLVLYTMSSIYHGLSPNVKGKKVIQILDHCTIFILIAGSYTPFALCTLREYDQVVRVVYFWSYMGSCSYRNYLKCYRFKEIPSFFYDMLSFNGLVHYY